MAEDSRELRWGVRQRLEFIEYRLLWEGEINRQDICVRFRVSHPQASADLGLYKKLALGNLIYDTSKKAYRSTPDFKPVFYEGAARDYLAHLRLISDGVKTVYDTWSGWLPSFDVTPFVRRTASTAKLQKILRAVHHKKTLRIRYQSMTRPTAQRRWIAPHALGFDGFRWHVRSWCCLREDFRDFVLARIEAIDSEDDQKGGMSAENDQEWHKFVTLHVGANPKLEELQRKVIERDYDMRDGKLEIEMRIALSFYFEKFFSLDLDQYEGVPPARQQIVLLNREEVEQARERAKRASSTISAS